MLQIARGRAEPNPSEIRAPGSISTASLAALSLSFGLRSFVGTGDFRIPGPTGKSLLPHRAGRLLRGPGRTR